MATGLANKRVLISGAGIAGPCLAWFLAKAGARVHIVERAPALLTGGQNIDIQGSARKVVDLMGLAEQVKRNNTTEKGSAFINDAGQLAALFPVVEGKTASFTSEWEILRSDLTRVFYDATKDQPEITYSFDTTVKRVLKNDEHRVKVELSTGEVQEYDLLVAADGQWSKMRRECFDEKDVTVIDKDVFAIYYTVPRTSADNDLWNIYPALRSRTVSTRPDPYGTIRALFSIMPRSETQRKAWQGVCRSSREAQEALTRSEFADAGWQTSRLLKAMSDAPDFYVQAVRQIKMKTWFTGCVVCLGDAGYAPTPLTGMGTSLAIIGSYLLAGELSLLKPEESPTRALETYESRFRKFVDDIQNVPFFVPAIAHPDSAWKRWLLVQGAWVVSKIVAVPWVTRWIPSGSEEEFPWPRYAVFSEQAPTEKQA